MKPPRPVHKRAPASELPLCVEAATEALARIAAASYAAHAAATRRAWPMTDVDADVGCTTCRRMMARRQRAA